MNDVIIVNFNSSEVAHRCIESLRPEMKERTVRVILVDNSDLDDLGCIRAAFPEVVVRRSLKNIGFARAVNSALRGSNSRYAVILNPDSIVMDGFWLSVLEYMDTHPEVGLLGPAILNSDGTIQGSARAFPGGLASLFGRDSPLSRLLPGNAITRANVLTEGSDGVTPMEVDWVSGACMVARRRAIHEVGLLDPRFFMYWEDADWCRRMWEKGWKVVYFPPARVMHFVGASSSTRPLRSLYEFHKSSYKLFCKHAGAPLRLLSPFAAFALAMRFGLFLAWGICARSAHRQSKVTAAGPVPG